ncbi:unnamed protein product [Brassicogethes aeneus]|uniref:methylated diphthine methylhydrolase n=1 Tax=Brassicogethes aeneus TaxID=1431903 RepID=A0A9P0BHC9_BRAAE|nr:unnamed protein product [Brassicogethes aeneus]
MTDLPESKNFKTLYSYDTVYCADSLEWCPFEPHQNLFVCANYQLLDAENKNDDLPKERVGRILLFSVDKDDGLKLLQTIDTAAVLDQKWCCQKIGDDSLLGVVNAKNTLEIYKLTTNESEGVKLEFFTSFSTEVEATETLFLSLDWSIGKFINDSVKIVCSTSKGDVLLFELINSKIKLLFKCHSHDYEAWIAAFYYWDPNIFFSGGDDCVFHKYDLRVGNSPISKNRSHEAGVTSIHCNISKEFILATGSYDENIRIWDIRNIKQCTSSIKMPGPVWRVKWDPFTQNNLLSACMLGGVHVINAENIENLEIVDSFYEHKNIAYGADWCYLPQDRIDVDFNLSESCIIGSCSFYDHLLCVSKIKLNLN